MATQAHNGYPEYRQGSPTPRTRSSTDSSVTKASLVRRDSLQYGSPDGQDDVVPTTFDESALRLLIDMDCGVDCMLDRIKQGMASAREAAVFLQKRAALEGDLGRSMHKLAVNTKSAYAANECKPGTFASAWDRAMTLHETIAENRLKLSANLSEMSEELSTLAKEVDKNRKQVKDTHASYERNYNESLSTLSKAYARFAAAQEDLERFVVAKEGENMRDARMGVPQQASSSRKGPGSVAKAISKGTMFNRKNPARQEDDVRSRMSAASTSYQKSKQDMQAIKSEYFNLQLPRTLRALKELSDEIDTAMQFHLSKYAYLLESSLLSDAVSLVPKGPEDGPGLKAIMESIDNRADFKEYVQAYRVANHGMGRGPQREDPIEPSHLPPVSPYIDRLNQGYPSQHNLPSMRNGLERGTATFGVGLVEQMERDGVEVPKIVTKCCEAIERYGLDVQGIYRLSGTHTKVNRLKELMDRDIDSVNLNTEEWTSDINNVTGVLKLWLRELPEPLMTNSLQAGFVEAARNENDRLRHIRLHERVNDLPDANYSTLKYLMGHLSKVIEQQAVNSMTVYNLALVFGPTLFGTNMMANGHPPMNGGPSPGGAAAGIGDVGAQNKAIETILDRYKDIFVEE